MLVRTCRSANEHDHVRLIPKTGMGLYYTLIHVPMWAELIVQEGLV